MRQVRRRLGDQMEDRYVRLDGDGLQRVDNPHSLYGDFKRTKDRVLKAIKDAGADGIRNAELAEASGVERHKLTGVAEGLQSQGLVYPSGVKRSKKDPLRWHPA